MDPASDISSVKCGVGIPTPDDLRLSEVDRLRAELAAVREENAHLAAEIERLRLVGERPGAVVAHRSERAPTLFPVAQEVKMEVDRGSSPQEKVALYRSLFAGQKRCLLAALGELDEREIGLVTGQVRTVRLGWVPSRR